MKQLRGVELKRFLRQNKSKKIDIVLMLENIQYAQNVATIFRTADAAGVRKLILSGISQKPPFGKDLKKASRSKEESVDWEYVENLGKKINMYKKQGYQIIALELTDESSNYKEFSFGEKIVLIGGSEVYGITKNTLEKVDASVFIPMNGKGASLNVSTALAVVMFNII
jgi:23S rRNA (guanosine2251-2'-O)-methyltransferase